MMAKHFLEKKSESNFNKQTRIFKLLSHIIHWDGMVHMLNGFGVGVFAWFSIQSSQTTVKEHK